MNAPTHYIHLGAMLHAVTDEWERVVATSSRAAVTCGVCLTILERRDGQD